MKNNNYLETIKKLNTQVMKDYEKNKNNTAILNLDIGSYADERGVNVSKSISTNIPNLVEATEDQ